MLTDPLRACVYMVHSSTPPVLGTLPYAFPPVVRPTGDEARASLARVSNAVFIVVLDWSEPWTFATQLATWLPAIARVVRGAYADSEDEADALRAEMQARCASHAYSV